jgi:HPt (histidine-containing phosphotransfer) domain-containing protein
LVFGSSKSTSSGKAVWSAAQMAEMLDFPVLIVDRIDKPVDIIVAPPLAPDVQSIDRTHLFRMTLGDHALECEVLQLFDQQAGMLIARMREANPAGVAALAHTLHGSARAIGAWAIARAAETLEVAAKNKSVEMQSAKQALARTVDDARRTIAALLLA